MKTAEDWSNNTSFNIELSLSEESSQAFAEHLRLSHDVAPLKVEWRFELEVDHSFDSLSKDVYSRIYAIEDFSFIVGV